jgi:hypothetical protein
MQIRKIVACSMLMALLAATATASATPPRATTMQHYDPAHAANPPTNMHPAIHPGPAVVRAFAETALQHLKGPAQRPFLELLQTLPPKGKEPGIAISTKATKNVSCSEGVCTPTAATAILNVSELNRLLVAGNVTIATSAVAPDIFINAPFSWTSANALTLQAIGDITVNKAVSNAGPGPLDLEYDITGGGGALSFGNKGSISFMGLANPLTINGQSYLLAADIRTMARLIQDNPSGNFALARSYDARRDGTYSQSPIPTPFQGAFEGLGNMIRNVHVESSGQVGGLFYETEQTAYVSNIRFSGKVEEESEANPVAGGLEGVNNGTLFGSSVPDSTLVFVSMAGDGSCIAGGLVGTNNGTVSFSHSSATVDASFDPSKTDNTCYVGGLVGYDGSNVFSGGSVSYSSWGIGSVSVSALSSGELEMGGLIGDICCDIASVANVSWTFATGNVMETGPGGCDCGGLVGRSEVGATIANSSAEGAVSANDNSVVGGFIGNNVASGVEGQAAVNVAAGAVSGGTGCKCGGFAGVTAGGGQLGGEISNAQSYGTVLGGSGSYIGGFVGYDYESQDIYDSGWCTTSSGITDPSQGAGNVPNDPGITPFTC